MVRSFAASLALAIFGACSTPARAPETLEGWLRSHAVPLRSTDALPSPLVGARVVGLGEATHGQHECFETKRALALELVRRHGFRWIAYEASRTGAEACEEYIAGRSEDLGVALSGLGMLIWQVEENARLLEDLRAWNAGAAPAERVHFVGIDVQDPQAAAAALSGELARLDPGLGARAEELARGLEAAVQKLWSGNPAEYEGCVATAREIEAALAAHAKAPGAQRRARLGRELRLGAEMFWSAGGRDLALARMLLAELEAAGPDARMVLWAHDAHVMRAPLRYQKSEELALGGHLGAELGEQYYALGFAFGEGEFLALDRGADGRFGFRRYAVGSPPAGSLEQPLAALCIGDFLLDLRGAPRDGAAASWVDTGHGQRTYGGYGIGADVLAASRDAARLVPTIPRGDYDGLVFLARTRATEPRDPRRRLEPQ